MAWLNAIPKPDARSKRAKQADQAAQISRLDDMKRQKVVPPMPPNPMPHLIDRLVEIGLTEPAGMGAAPISWQSIIAWQQAVGVPLAAWEARLLRKLSTEYLAESRRAESENCPPPWRAPVTDHERETEAQRLQMVLG
ncbi:MAG: hypothetical protein U5M50_04240 [Sphingobium sp.]|nr:hypothetical protein [Sphingobium sp.]